MRELFIYYRISPSRTAEARRLVLDFQARLRDRHPGLQARLLRRPADPLTEQTWMEIYSRAEPAPAGGITPELEAEIAVEAAVLAPCLNGSRHVEVFEPCAW